MRGCTLDCDDPVIMLKCHCYTVFFFVPSNLRNSGLQVSKSMKFIFQNALASLVFHFFGLYVLSFSRHLRFAVEGVQKHEKKHGGNELWPILGTL